MIAFIEGGMPIPMGTITRNYLMFFRLSPTQCAPNMFRVLGSIEALNERVDLNLTHHDVNWVYNLHHLKGQGYYLKSRYPAVRLIQCLPTSNKNLKEDFLIFSAEWHDGLPCPMEEGEPDRRSTKPKLSLANKTSLDRALKAEIYPALREEEVEEKGEEEEKEEEEEESPEEVVELSHSSDNFGIFNQTIHSEEALDKMGVQRKPQKSLMELIENQPGKSAPGKSTQSQIPPFPTRSPPPTPHQPPQPVRADAAELKRHREQKGKDVVDTGKSHPTREENVQRAAKQQKISHTLQRGQDRSDTQPPEPQAWLPAPMHGGEPLRDDASIRDFNGGIGCHIASAIEEALLLPKDMTEIKNARKNELILNNKRYLGMVIQNTFRLDEMLNNCYNQLEDERKRRASAAAREQVAVLKKHLEETQKLREQAEKSREETERAKAKAEQATNEAEQKGYDLGVAKTEETLKVMVPMVCRIYCAQTWNEAFNRAGVEASSELRKAENVFYPTAIRASNPPSSQAEDTSSTTNPNQEVLPQNLPPPGQLEPTKETNAPPEASLDMTAVAFEAEVASQGL
ncbi:uncharacterized protein LOC126728748 [Quercus robur]|uniref:uncharacterized protein LOC126728748 n=1 Tax=Quercus robur TaxID=38942 RepID=UPI002162F287|nr:uncharacterized protein LOC126728748 [Quercus robur]